MGQGLGEGGRAVALLGPASGAQRPPRPGDGKIRHPENVQPGRVQGLGQEHGTKLAGPDEADAQRPSLLGPGQEHAMESQGFIRDSPDGFPRLPTMVARRAFAPHFPS